MRGLESVKILVVRPGHRLAKLCCLIGKEGGIPMPLPLLDITGPIDASAARVALERARHAGLWIFTSPNAVTWSSTISPPTPDLPWPHQLAAVGQGTADALQKLTGSRNILVPPADGAKALLSMPQLQDVKERTILIVRGERPLPFLENRLRALDAIVLTAEVYRRKVRPVNPDEVASLIIQADAAIVTSGESLRALRRATPTASVSKLLTLQLVVPSMRVVKVAMEEMGFRLHPLVPDRVSDDEFVQALLRWNGHPLHTLE